MYAAFGLRGPVSVPTPILHIGLPKTATTMLQRAIFLRHTDIYYLGKPFRPPGAAENGTTALPRDIIRALWAEDSLSFNLKATKDALVTAFQPGRRTDKAVLLSEEALAAAGFADRRLIAERLRSLFGPCNILITIRNQETALPSLYRHYLRKGLINQRPFDSWLECACSPTDFAEATWGWMLSQYRYYDLHVLYRDIFPNNEIKVLLYEQMTNEPEVFCRELSTFLGIDLDQTLHLLAAAEKLNEGLSYSAIQRERGYSSLERIYAQLRQRLFPDFGLRSQLPTIWNLKETVRRRAIKASSGTESKRYSSCISEKTRSLLSPYYAENNRKLAEMCGLALTRYGYPV